MAKASSVKPKASKSESKKLVDIEPYGIFRCVTHPDTYIEWSEESVYDNDGRRFGQQIEFACSGCREDSRNLEILRNALRVKESEPEEEDDNV